VLAWDRPFRHPILQRAAEQKRRLILVTSHRRENQGAPQEKICSALLRLARTFPDLLIVFPVHLNPSVRDTVLPLLEKQDGILLIEPLDYLETIHFMKAAHIILTDSGGIQEEAPELGKPVLVLRDATERPEGLATGSARLVGTDPESILSAASALLTDASLYARMSQAANPYGDGRASGRIIQALEFLAGRAASPASF